MIVSYSNWLFATPAAAPLFQTTCSAADVLLLQLLLYSRLPAVLQMFCYSGSCSSIPDYLQCCRCFATPAAAPLFQTTCSAADVLLLRQLLLYSRLPAVLQMFCYSSSCSSIPDYLQCCRCFATPAAAPLFQNTCSAADVFLLRQLLLYSRLPAVLQMFCYSGSCSSIPDYLQCCRCFATPAAAPLFQTTCSAADVLLLQQLLLYYRLPTVLQMFCYSSSCSTIPDYLLCCRCFATPAAAPLFQTTCSAADVLTISMFVQGSSASRCFKTANTH